METTFKDLKMQTLEKLQSILQGKVEIIEGSDYKELSPSVVCADGARLSVQASYMHYSTPRDNYGPYSEVEVWCANCPVNEFKYSDDGPSAYVNIHDVVKLIDNHGGFKG